MVTSSRLRTIPTDPVPSSNLGAGLPLPGTSGALPKAASVRVFSVFTDPLRLPYIKNIVPELLQIDGIELVRPVFQVPGDYHNVVFQIKLLNSINPTEEDFDQEPQPEKIERILEKARNLVFQKCRSLRNITNEKWYFRTELISDYNAQIPAI
jgi:hypothetical protein